MTQQHPLISQILAYQEACNRFDMQKAVTYFTDDGVIDVHGQIFAGRKQLVDLHDYDTGCGALVYLSEFQVEENRVRCLFVYESQADRLLGISGLARWSTLTFRGDLAERWDIEAPTPEEVQRRRPVMGPVFAWARDARPDLMARLEGEASYETGHALTEIAEAYLAAHPQANAHP